VKFAANGGGRKTTIQLNRRPSFSCGEQLRADPELLGFAARFMRATPVTIPANRSYY
jgi:hypothetical protein